MSEARARCMLSRDKPEVLVPILPGAGAVVLIELPDEPEKDGEVVWVAGQAFIATTLAVRSASPRTIFVLHSLQVPTRMSTQRLHAQAGRLTLVLLCNAGPDRLAVARRPASVGTGPPEG